MAIQAGQPLCGVSSDRGSAARALDGTASRWWRLETNNGQHQFSMEEFKAKNLECFKPVNAEQRARDKIASMRQTGSAKVYADRFRSAILDIPKMSEAWQLDAFTRGLKPNVRRELERYPTASLNEAIRVAERIDSIDFMFSRGSAQPRELRQHERAPAWEPRQPETAGPPADGPVPMELGPL